MDMVNWIIAVGIATLLAVLIYRDVKNLVVTAKKTKENEGEDK